MNFSSLTPYYAFNDIVYKYFYDLTPSVIFLNGVPYFIYPFDIVTGVRFFYKLLNSVVFPSLMNVQDEMFLHQFSQTMKCIDFNKFCDLILEAYNYSECSLEEIKDFEYNLRNATLKEITYFLYIIKKQNFFYSLQDKLIKKQSSVGQLYDKLLKLKEEMIKVRNEGEHVENSDGEDYNGIVDVFFDASNQIEKQIYDYLSNDYYDLYILQTSILNKFFLFCRYQNLMVPSFYKCHILGNDCLSSCRFFDFTCHYRKMMLSYIPYKAFHFLYAIYEASELRVKFHFIEIVAKILSLFFNKDSMNKTMNMKLSQDFLTDELFSTNFLYMQKLKEPRENDHLIDFNYLYKIFDLSTSHEKTFEDLYLILLKVYNFLNKNFQLFSTSKNKNIVSDFINKLELFLSDVTNVDFTFYLKERKDFIVKLEKILLKFPYDMENLDFIVNQMLTEMNKSEKSGVKIADPRKALMESPSPLHRRIAVDNALWEFYKENKKTKKINNSIFWKQSISIFQLAQYIIPNMENHEIQNIEFNDV